MTMNWLIGETEKANAEIALGHYTAYRDMALNISTGRIKKAQCHADLMASGMFDSVKDCLREESCKQRLQPHVLRSAPEILSGVPITFNYITTKNGGKGCDENSFIE